MPDFSFFDQGADRSHTHAIKWDTFVEEMGADHNPMWVADMDFQCVPEVQKAIEARAAHPVYGYTNQSEQAVRAMQQFMKRRHKIDIAADTTFLLPGVVSGLRLTVRTYTKPGDKIIIQPPLYPPFFKAITGNGRVAAECPMHKEESGRYQMNYEAIEDALKGGARCMMLCNPHNPVGRCWTKEELQTLLALLRRYNATLISDEIHEDFVYAPHVFIPMQTLCTPEDRVVSLTSASKTFNLAGLMQAFGYTANREMLAQIKDEIENSGVESGNLFSFAATEAAYTYGDAWLDSLLAYLREGDRILRSELQKRLPLARLTPLEATYLEWLDLSAYGFSCEELTKRTHAVKLVCNAGNTFGREGEMHLRINIACPHERIRRAAEQLEQAIMK